MERYSPAEGTVRSRSVRFLVAIPLLAAVAISAAVPEVSAQVGRGTTKVAFVNGTPDAPTVDLYVDGDLTVEDLAYGEASEVVELPAGQRNVAVAATGDGADAPIVESVVTLLRGGAYVVANVDLLANADIRSWRINLDPVGDDEARLRVIHASPDAPEVDIAVAGGDVLIAGATFDTAPAAIEVDAGTYDVEMRPAGSRDVVQEIPNVTLPPATACTVIALGLLNDDGALDVAAVFSPLNLVGRGGFVATGGGPDALAGATGTDRGWLLTAIGALGSIAAAAAVTRRAGRAAR